jgi:hypothetical protein
VQGQRDEVVDPHSVEEAVYHIEDASRGGVGAGLDIPNAPSISSHVAYQILHHMPIYYTTRLGLISIRYYATIAV